jgi:hypothetical protein
VASSVAVVAAAVASSAPSAACSVVAAQARRGRGALGMNTTGLPGPVVDTITTFVAEKSGLDEGKAPMAVNVLLPKLVEFVKSKMT